MKSNNKFIKCGKYSEVLVANDSLIFKTNEEYVPVDFDYIKENFNINSLQDNEVYKTFNMLYSCDAFIKRGKELYFIHKKDFSKSGNNIYFIAYNLEEGVFHEIELKDILVDDSNKPIYFCYFSAISIYKDEIIVNYKSYIDEDAFEIKTYNLKIDSLGDDVEYCINEKDGKKDCIKKLNNIIYFYNEDLSTPPVSTICFSYNIETGEIDDEIKEYAPENTKALDAIFNLANLNVEFYDTGINTKTTAMDNCIEVRDDNNKFKTYAIPLLEPNRFYILNRMGKLLDFMVLIEDKVLFGYGVLDGDSFKNTFKKVYDIKLNKFLEPSEEHEDLLEKLENNSSICYRNDEESYNNLMCILKEGTSNVSNEDVKSLVEDLISEIINLNNCIELYSNSFLQSQGVDKFDNNVITNTVVKYEYIKEFLNKGKFLI